MAQKLIQTQKQEQKLQQRLSQQQMLQVKLLEMPLAEFEESIAMELDDNPALETASPEDALYEEAADRSQEAREESFEEQTEREERQDALEKALEGIGRDDEMPETFHADSNSQNADYEEIVYGDTTSFYDKLKEQIGELDLNDTEREVMEYLIGSLDSDGLLRKDLSTLSDELALYHNIYTDEKDIQQLIAILQTFDPPGIGARSLQECLLIQIERKRENNEGSAVLLKLMKKVIEQHYDDFTHNNWSAIADAIGITDEAAREVQREILRLNPKPGAAMGETEGRSTQQITPDFIVDTDDNGNVSFVVTSGRVPQLSVSPMFSDIVRGFQQKKSPLSRQEKEAYVYARDKIDRAQGYITALQQRRHTLYTTMRSIIDWQKKFFEYGDENDLRPMVLKDIAERTGLDISTISRVCNSKYCQTRWGIFRLRHFFSEGVKTADGEELSVHQIKNELQDIVDHEDKQHPLSDDQLALQLKERGFPIARRTVAKYRGQLGIPTARMRRT